MILTSSSSYDYYHDVNISHIWYFMVVFSFFQQDCFKGSPPEKKPVKYYAMDDILAREVVNNEKLDELKSRRAELLNRNGKKYKSILDIEKPVDSCIEIEKRKKLAVSRNADFLQELELTIGKLHTKRLCPINKKLAELKNNFLQKY